MTETPKRVRIIKSTLAEKFEDHRLTSYRVLLLADGIGYFTVAGFPSRKEAKAYRRKLLEKYDD